MYNITPSELVTVIITVLQMRESRHWKCKKLAQSHTGGKNEMKAQIIFLKNLCYSPVHFTTAMNY